jgi:hypothetical protein
LQLLMKNSCRQFFIVTPNFQKVTRNVFRIEFPIKWYIDTDDDKLQSNNSGQNI